MDKFSVVLLAAGKGRRMKSSLPKVLMPLKGQPLIYYILKELLALQNSIKQIIIIVGYKDQLVIRTVVGLLSLMTNQSFEQLNKKIKINFIKQEKLLGTADAVKCGQDKIKYDNVLVLCADTPLITKETIANFINFFLLKKSPAALITAYVDSGSDLGRIIRDETGAIKAIKEKIELTEQVKENQLEEINSGIYCFKSNYLKYYINNIKKNDKKKEYFLTDIIQLLYNDGKNISPFVLKDKEEILGINTRNDLYYAQNIMQKRILYRLIEEGVNIINLETTFIEEGVKIGQNTTIFPFTFIEKDVIIGQNCLVGPFIHIRKAVKIEANSHMGNFLEVSRSQIGRNVKIKHFAYIGDSQIEDNVNIGAGTVIANFDGKNKQETKIKKDAFIGSDTTLVAPLTIGEKAITGAGSVVTKDVKDKTIVVGVPAKFLRNNK